jgi:predicted DNA-binding transcriptional regulator YafY
VSGITVEGVKSDRLLALLLLLQARSPRSATRLAEELEVSARTIYRDAEALSAAGVPVYAERGRSGGIALMPGYRTQVPGLTPDEARALFVLTTDAAHTDLGLGEAIGSALRKVQASLPQGQQGPAEILRERVLIDPARWGAQDSRPEHLDAVQTAVLEGRRARVTYRSSSGRVGGYTLDPLGLVGKAGVWHLVAEHRRTLKTFRVDRMRAVTILTALARRRNGFQLQAAWEEMQRDFEGTLRVVPVRIRVRRRILPRVLRLYDQGDAASPVGAPEDWVEVTLRFPALAAAQALLAHGPDLEVLEPLELRERLGELGRQVARLYD